MTRIALCLTFLFTALFFISCKTGKEAVLPADCEWASYERQIDAANDCEELFTAYTSFYRKLIADDGQITADRWREYHRSTRFLEKKINRKGRRFCGFTFFETGNDSGFSSEDRENDVNDLEDKDSFEDNFDYDEFDSTL